MATEQQRKDLTMLVAELAPFEGWTNRALYEAASELGFSRERALVLFPRAIKDVVRAFNLYLDQVMEEALPATGFDTLKVRERIATLIKARLNAMEPYRDGIKTGRTFFVMPYHVSDAAHSLYDTVDRMWRLAGDQSEDYNFYSKRFLLSGVYSSTLLYWLEDSSDDYEKSSYFLDRRIAEVLRLGGTMGKGISRLQEIGKGIKIFSPLNPLTLFNPLRCKQSFVNQANAQRYPSVQKPAQKPATAP